MEIKGKVILALPEQSGVSKSGNSWKKREYVLETLDNFPKKIHFDLFGDRADQYPIAVGETITLSFDIESREFNGRWYTSIRGWKVDKDNVGAAVNTDITGGAVPPPPVPDFTSGGSDEDLPF
ncbi:MAG: DUF3127 domain-containing protein [Paramuribaculum sp.]|nr:DUF3127 domain-containing protein [Paramuribaculum sp.]